MMAADTVAALCTALVRGLSSSSSSTCRSDDGVRAAAAAALAALVAVPSPSVVPHTEQLTVLRALLSTLVDKSASDAVAGAAVSALAELAVVSRGHDDDMVIEVVPDDDMVIEVVSRGHDDDMVIEVVPVLVGVIAAPVNAQGDRVHKFVLCAVCCVLCVVCCVMCAV